MCEGVCEGVCVLRVVNVCEGECVMCVCVCVCVGSCCIIWSIP